MLVLIDFGSFFASIFFVIHDLSLSLQDTCFRSHWFIFKMIQTYVRQLFINSHTMSYIFSKTHGKTYLPILTINTYFLLCPRIIKWDLCRIEVENSHRDICILRSFSDAVGRIFVAKYSLVLNWNKKTPVRAIRLTFA